MIEGNATLSASDRVLRRRKSGLFLHISICFGGAWHAALGQELDEVVVTAQKTSENEQRVPISLTAIRSDLLDRLNVGNVADLALLVPGLSVSSVGPGQFTTSIRGLASDPNLVASTVAYYVDETPISAIDAGLFDVSRVEVLRGPQGTLYGSSSMGGTIRYISQRPDPAA